MDPEYITRFYEEIEAIRLATEQAAQLVPAQLIELNDKLTEQFDVYKNAGPSRAEPSQNDDQGGGSGWSTRDDRSARQSLPNHGRRPNDPNESYTDGGGRLPSGPSWESRTVSGGLGDVLPLPRYPGAEPNAADLLGYLASASANMAQKRQTKQQAAADQAQQQAEQQRQAVVDRYTQQYGDVSNMNPDQLNQMFDDVQQIEPEQTSTGNLWGKMSDSLAGLESGYAQSRYIKGIVSRVARPVTDMQQLGFQTGSEGGSPGPFGLRMPWDPATLAGVEQRVSRLGMSFGSNAVTPSQANTIMENLYGQGWMNNNSQQVQNMRTASQQIMRFNPALGSMPQTYDMMDESTRQGAASLEHFVDVMKGVPDSMNAAHLSMQQVMADMDALGQQNKAMGGTYIAGMENAQQWNNVTGLPAGVMGQLMQNPMVQGQTFMRTGLIPWEQGLASPGQHMQGILGALNVMSGSIRTPASISSQIGNSGFYNTVSGQDQKEALMSRLMGVDKATIHTMLSNQHGWQVGGQMGDESTAYFRDVQKAIRQKDPAAAAHILSGQGAGTWGQLKTDLGAAVDSEGKHIFSTKEIQAIENTDHGGAIPKGDLKGHYAWQPGKAVGPGGGPGGHMKYIPGAGHWDTEHKGLYASHTWVPDKTTGKSAAQVAYDRAQRIQSDIAKDTAKRGATGSQSGPRLTIELGPAAKKVFHLQDPNGQQKAAQNAGAVSINQNSYANGPTYAPAPNLDSVSGDNGTYNYGSQYDTGNW